MCEIVGVEAVSVGRGCVYTAAYEEAGTNISRGIELMIERGSDVSYMMSGAVDQS